MRALSPRTCGRVSTWCVCVQGFCVPGQLEPSRLPPLLCLSLGCFRSLQDTGGSRISSSQKSFLGAATFKEVGCEALDFVPSPDEHMLRAQGLPVQAGSKFCKGKPALPLSGSPQGAVAWGLMHARR